MFTDTKRSRRYSMLKTLTEHDLTRFDSAEIVDVQPSIRPCDLCGATDSLDTPGDPSGKIRICSGCGFVHVKERRSVEEVANAWEQIYARGGYDPNWSGVRARLFYTAQWLDSNIGLRGKSVLDIGCGNGNFLGYCQSLGAAGVGIDPSRDNVAVAKGKGILCYEGWASDTGIDLGRFDFVTLTWTLENTADCLEVLRYAKRQLKPGGHVVVATGSRIGHGFRKPLGSYIPQDPNYPHDTHCFRWSAATLFKALGVCGLTGSAHNDYKERDEMIMCAQRDPARTDLGGDHPKYIQDYFRRWQEMFP